MACLQRKERLDRDTNNKSHVNLDLDEYGIAITCMMPSGNSHMLDTAHYSSDPTPHVYMIIIIMISASQNATANGRRQRIGVYHAHFSTRSLSDLGSKLGGSLSTDPPSNPHGHHSHHDT